MQPNVNKLPIRWALRTCQPNEQDVPGSDVLLTWADHRAAGFPRIIGSASRLPNEQPSSRSDGLCTRADQTRNGFLDLMGSAYCQFYIMNQLPRYDAVGARGYICHPWVPRSAARVPSMLHIILCFNRTYCGFCMASWKVSIPYAFMVTKQGSCGTQGACTPIVLNLLHHRRVNYIAESCSRRVYTDIF